MKNREQRYNPDHATYEAMRVLHGFTEEQAADFRYKSTLMSADNPLSDYSGRIDIQANIYKEMITEPTETTTFVGKVGLNETAMVVPA